MTKEPTQGAAQLLRGRIQNLRKMRCRRDFVFTASDRTNMGATAIAEGVVGLGGVAAGLGGRRWARPRRAARWWPSPMATAG